MDEQLSGVRRDAGHLAWRRVACDHDLAALPRLPHHLVGSDLGALNPDRLAPLQAPEIACVGDSETARGLHVETPGPLGLHVGVAERLHPVLDGEPAHLEAIVSDALAGLELHQLDLVAELAEDPPE